MNFKGIAKTMGDTIIKHSPEILTGIGIAGMLTTTVLAVSATPKALKLIDIHKKEQKAEKLPPVEVVKATWKCYIPAVVTATASTACLIGASAVNNKRNAVLATAYSLSENALKTYREKVVETVGEKKEQEIRDAVAKEQLQKNPIINKEVIITPKGETLCFDAISGRYFKCDIEAIRRTEAELNRELNSCMYVSLNEFYYKIGLRPTKLGDDLGWNVDNGPITFSFSSQLTEDDQPCLVIDYDIAPRYDYRNLM